MNSEAQSTLQFDWWPLTVAVIWIATRDRDLTEQAARNPVWLRLELLENAAKSGGALEPVSAGFNLEEARARLECEVELGFVRAQGVPIRTIHNPPTGISYDAIGEYCEIIPSVARTLVFEDSSPLDEPVWSSGRSAGSLSFKHVKISRADLMRIFLPSEEGREQNKTLVSTARRGRPPQYDWDAVCLYAKEIFFEKGDFDKYENKVNGWRTQSDLEELVLQRLQQDSEKEGRTGPAVSTVREHIASWLPEWRKEMALLANK